MAPIPALNPARNLLVGHRQNHAGIAVLLDGVARGEGALYITLTETAEELNAVAATHGWSLDQVCVFERVNETTLEPDSECGTLTQLERVVGRLIRSSS